MNVALTGLWCLSNSHHHGAAPFLRALRAYIATICRHDLA